jgi:hypothetical protein
VINHAEPLTFRDAGSAPNKTMDFIGKTALLDGQPQRAAQQPDANQSDFLPVHGKKIED